jgi:CO/xanthine dehydrogenase Mo-binding subunit
MTSNIVRSEAEYRVVGKRPLRPDGVDKVTGRAQYGADVILTGLLHGHWITGCPQPSTCP